MTLIEPQIKRTKPSAMPHKISDNGGLFFGSGIPVERFGASMQIMRGKAKLMTFGSYPDVSLSLARERHADQ